MIVKTLISYGFKDLLDIFFTANELDIKCIPREVPNQYGQLIDLEYDENSETSTTITYMSYKHLGFENMLVDYIIRCGYPSTLISVGRVVENRDMNKLEEAWQEERKRLGLTR